MDKINDLETIVSDVIEYLHTQILNEDLTEKEYFVLCELVAIELEEPVPFDDIVEEF